MTYQTIADNLGLSRSAVKRRVDHLIEQGVIEKFIIELSRKMVQYEWMSVDLTTDGTEDVVEFVKKLNKHPMVYVLAWIRDKRYLVYCHVDSQFGMYEVGRFLRSQDEVEEALLHPMIPVNNETLSPISRFLQNGKQVEFTQGQLRVLRSLYNDARKSISQISKETGLNSRRVKAILEELNGTGGVHFTIQFNFSAAGNTNLILKHSFNEAEIEPSKIVKWIQKKHPFEYWNSFLIINEPTMLSLFTCLHMKDVERITLDMKNKEFTTSAEAYVLYPSRASRSLGRVRLKELLGIESPKRKK